MARERKEFSRYIYESMMYHGYTNAAEAYLRKPWTFPDQATLKAVWGVYEVRRRNLSAQEKG